MIRLSPVDPTHLGSSLEQALQRVKDKTGDRWSVPFVLGRVAGGHAGLFEIRGDSHLGYVVLERYEQGDAPWMNVWILEGAGLEHVERVIGLLDDKCKEIGCVAWRCTGRKGWAKYLRPVATVYERAVT